MKWISQEELKAHISEYGEHSYEAIVVEVFATDDCEPYIDIVHSHTHINDKEIGRVCIVPYLESK